MRESHGTSRYIVHPKEVLPTIIIICIFERIYEVKVGVIASVKRYNETAWEDRGRGKLVFPCIWFILLNILKSYMCLMCVLSCFSNVRFFVTLWTVALQSPLSMGFSRQEYRSGLPFPSPWDLPDPGIEPQISCIAGGFFIVWATLKK